MRSVRPFLLFFLALLLADVSSAAPPIEIRPQRFENLDLRGLNAEGQLSLEPVARIDGKVPQTELDWILAEYHAAKAGWKIGDGGAHDVTFGSLELIQTDFVESECPENSNVVFLIWSEETPNPTGVDIYVDDRLIANYTNDLFPNDPGNGVFITGVPAGMHTFRIEETNVGTFDELSIEVLDAQPFGDASDLQADPGPIVQGDCTVWFSFGQSGPVPERQLVLTSDGIADFSPLGTLTIPAGDPFFLQRSFLVGGFTAGDLAFQLIGFSNAEDGGGRVQYRGCFRNSPVAPVDCVADACGPPAAPWVAQTGYSGGAGPGEVVLFWSCPEEAQNGTCLSHDTVRLLADGSPIGEFAASSDFQFLTRPVGPFVLGLQGLCQTGDSSVREKDLEILAESPFTDPVVDGRVIRNDTADGTAQLSWTYDARSAFAFVWVNGNIVASLPGELPGMPGSLDIGGAQPDDEISLQFFRYVDGQAYGSERIVAGSETPIQFFVRGLCSGNTSSSDPQITDAIALLSSLFLGAGPRPCQVACDTNASGRLELTDAVVILQYLFQGGPAPTGWVGRTPTCEAFVEGVPGFDLGCETPLVTCEEAGPIGG